MPAALDAALYLIPILVCLVLLGLLHSLKWTFQSFAGALDVGVSLPSYLGGVSVHPFSFLANAIDSILVDPINKGITSVDRHLDALFNGLTASLKLLVGAGPLIVVGVYDLLTYLWKQAFPSKINARVAPVQTTANKALALANSLAADSSGANARATSIAKAQAAGALTSAKSYTDTKVSGAVSSLGARIDKLTTTTIPDLIAADVRANGEIGKAIAKAINSSDFVNSQQVKSTIAQDLAAGGSIANAIAHAVASAGATSPADVAGAIGKELQPGGSIARAIAAAIAAALTIATVTGSQPGTSTGGGTTTIIQQTGETADEVSAQIADAIAHELAAGGAIANAIAATLPAPVAGTSSGEGISLGDLAAKVAATAAAVAAIEAIGFIGNESCRGKVSQLCGTDAGRLAGLLGGLGVVATALDFGVLVKGATELVQEGEAAVRKLAQLGEDAVNDAGHAVGAAANAIAG